ncbi:MAG: hypothetical protein VB086_10860 [Clostridiaceae bacterium]|nr:hypothetical protein [Clostridiaceae bacterium]
MMKSKILTMKMAIISSVAVAVFTVLFVIALITTFNFSPWNGIESYAAGFKPIQLLTVIPSILLAVSFLIFCVSVHYLSHDDQKIWSHLSMNFGLVYITISLANYLIQLITVTPSVMSGSLNGLEKLVSGYPNSVFFALMGSYFFMCISLFFEGLLFKKEIRLFLFIASIGCVSFFIASAIFSVTIFLMLGAICWIGGTVIAMTLISNYYLKKIKQLKV